MRLLRAAQLEPEQLESAGFRVPCSEVYRLCELAIELTEDPALGLHWAEKLSGDTFNPISHMLAHSGTLRQAFESLSQFRRLLTDQASYELLESGDSVTIRCVAPPSVSLRARRFTVEMLLTSLVRLIKSFNLHARPRRVNFEYAAPPYSDEYTRVFEGTERFKQPFTGIVFDSTLMNAVSPHKDDDVHRALRSIAEQRVLQLTNRMPYSVRVRDFLVQQAPSGRAEMASVARSLGMSVRSLRRRMDAEGKTFNEVASDAQSIVAKNLLRNTDRTIQDLAYQLGFADTSS
ncbi:MAG TPA: AraC family transcriptional regulator ligand-binding domain-containing protein, partial [Polyangiales bacterium]